MYDSDCGFWTKDCNLGAPRVVMCSSQVLASHGNVCATISLAYDARYFGHGRLTVCKQAACSVPDDAIVLLITPGRYPGVSTSVTIEMLNASQNLMVIWQPYLTN